MPQRKAKGTKLKVFSGREARLNRIIFLVMLNKGLLTSYEVYLEVRRVKGFRNIRRQNIDRRMKNLYQQNWLEVAGTKLAKAHFLSPVYRLHQRAIAAFHLAVTDLNTFLQTATEEQLKKLTNSLLN